MTIMLFSYLMKGEILKIIRSVFVFFVVRLAKTLYELKL